MRWPWRLAIALYVAACRKDTPKTTAIPVIPAPEHEEVAESIYKGGLQDGWQDVGFCARETHGPGPAALHFGGRGGWIVAKPALKTEKYGALVMRVKPPKGDVDFLEVRVESPARTTFPRVALRPEHLVGHEDGWTRVRVPFFELDPDEAAFDRIVIRAFREVDDGATLIDGLALTKLDASSEAARYDPRSYASKAKPTSVRVTCDAKAHRISPYIYGIAYDAAKEGALAQWQMGATARRFGGNPATRYNWEKGVWNTGNDWFFENRSVPSSWEKIVDDAAGHGLASAFTVPMIGWVAKDATSHSFPVSVYGPQARVDPNRKDAGDGTLTSGANIVPGPPTRTSVAAPPEWVKRWVVAIRAREEARGTRDVFEYILDNEPSAWSKIHRDVRPDPLGYDELLDRTIQYGTAVRQADPAALIAGPAEWGWTNYFYSAKDGVAGYVARPDRRAHDDMPLVEWYLKKLHEHEEKTGVRVLDVLDLHMYPQAPDVFPGEGVMGEKTAELRLRQTRGLWDPSYVDESWIKEPVRILPRMKEWVDKYYPGRRISIGEWNWGGERHITGALAAAETLGRFAQYGVYSAFYWTHPPDGSALVQGFLAFRNFDGNGGRFLDGYLPTKSEGPVSLFASRDDAGQHLVAVAINMSAEDALLAHVELTACGPIASRAWYAYMKGASGFVRVDDRGPKDEIILPPWSIAVLDVRLAHPITGAIE